MYEGYTDTEDHQSANEDDPEVDDCFPKDVWDLVLLTRGKSIIKTNTGQP